MHACSGIHLETGERVNVPQEFWRAVARSLNMSPKGLHYAATALCMFERSVAGLKAQRAELGAQLQAVLAGTLYRPYARCKYTRVCVMGVWVGVGGGACVVKVKGKAVAYGVGAPACALAAGSGLASACWC